MKRALPVLRAQASMESEAVAAIYESRLWRRSVLAHWLLRISFENEYALVSRSLGLRDADRVLDLGCGTGIYTRPLPGESGS